MAEVSAHAEIRIFGETVGAVAELDNGRVLFEYADSFRGRGLEISPIHLPTSLRGPIAFDELRKSQSFDGLPGVLADALPDTFGNRVIRAWFAARGEADRALSPVQRLLYVGERALGALSFHPATRIPTRAAEIQSLELAALVRDARRIVQGDPKIAIPEIYRIGASAGGIRPKALIRFEPATRTIRSANAPPKAGDIPCILKFDGVGDGDSADALGRPQPFNRIEAAYTEMARAAGLEATQITMLEEDGFAHLLVHRFDVEGAQRRHQHSLGGLIHVDYNMPGASSYEEFLRCILRLGMPYAGVEQGYLRMLFNVFAVNQDDHVKNLSFHMDSAGRWRLAPAYDLTFARGHGFTVHHQMRVNDKVSGIALSDLLEVGKVFGINDPAALIERMAAAIARWEEFAAAAKVPKKDMGRVRVELDRRARELARGSGPR
ncbi:MAG TPA: type II toxin-antitoxin system HipA family toxin [Planctomycetota bacterium]|nr:type II toxin-antitoxin system HipA family toxin [Planctomycetota bacterium]